MSDERHEPSDVSLPLGCFIAMPVVAAVIWGALAWFGYSLHAATAARVPDSPYLPAQLRYYVLIPVGIAILAGLQSAAALRWRRLAPAIAAAGAVELFVLLPYMLPYTGGI
jgi:hypothetical protein